MSTAEAAYAGGGRHWIANPAFDLVFFILSPVAGLLLLAVYPLGGAPALLLVATLVGGPHYLATYSFYFWDDTAMHRRTRWLAYFVGPLVIILGVGLVALFNIPAAIPLLIYFWNTYHVSRQSCGILSIYRQHAGDALALDRMLANGAIMATGFAMALSHPGWYPLLQRLLTRIWLPLPAILPAALAAIAAVSLAALGWSLWRRHREGRDASSVELAFLASSLLLFHPYLWVHDSNLATLALLFGHFIQYLGIVWLVNSRKSVTANGSAGQRIVQRLWRDPMILIPALLAAGGLFMLLQVNLMAATITLVLLHFYLDGLFWAFRHQAIRASLGPCLFGRN